MSRADWTCILFIVIGIVLFLIGANYWIDVVGWLGVFLVLSGVVALILLYVYNSLSKPRPQITSDDQNP